MAKAKRPFKNLVARRELTVERSRGKVSVEIGKPYADDRCHTCQVRISYGKKTVHQEIHGVDAFQSLELALKMIPTFLRHSDELPLGRMYAFEKGDDMGFPETNWPKYPGDEAQ
jgi:hypothetical protein